MSPNGTYFASVRKERGIRLYTLGNNHVTNSVTVLDRLFGETTKFYHVIFVPNTEEQHVIATFTRFYATENQKAMGER